MKEVKTIEKSTFFRVEERKKGDKTDKNSEVRMELILGKKDTFLERWGELGENWKALRRRKK